MTSNRKLERIRALLDQAEGEAEQGHAKAAENFRNKAMELMAAHGIEETMLSARTQKDEQPTSIVMALTRPYPVNKSDLLQGIAKALGCRAVRHGQAWSTVVGFQSDLDRIEMLYTSLLTQAFGELARERIPPWENTISFRTAWLAAFTRTVRERLEDAEARARDDYERQSGTSTALVVRDRSGAVEQAFTNQFPRIKTSKRKFGSFSGWDAGEAAGRRADIGAKQVGGNRPALDG